jgi:hypothetical protein
MLVSKSRRLLLDIGIPMEEAKDSQCLGNKKMFPVESKSVVFDYKIELRQVGKTLCGILLDLLSIQNY